MGYFKRAITCITRKMGKSVILLLLVFILGNVIAGAISVSQSVKNTQDAVEKNIMPVATVSLDYEKVIGIPEYEADPLSMRLTGEKIEAMGALSCVESFDYPSYFWGYSEDMLQYYPPEGKEAGYNATCTRADISIQGSRIPEFLEYRTGQAKLIDGRLLTEEEFAEGTHSVVISKYMAETNNLRVGSTFVLYTDIYEYVPNGPGVFICPGVAEVIDFDYTVVGIYEYVDLKPSDFSTRNAKGIGFSSSQDDINWDSAIIRFNTIYTSNTAVKPMLDFYLDEECRFSTEWERTTPYIEPYFIFKNKADLNEFIETYTDVVGDFYKVEYTDGNFDGATVPLKNISKLADKILFAGVGSSLIILSLLITLFLKDRRSEIGIYLALGERITKIIAQILLEVLLVAILGITLSLLSGNFISKQLTNYMINSEVIAQHEVAKDPKEPDYSTLTYRGFRHDLTIEQLAEQYDVSLNLNIILMFYIVGIGTVLLSTLIPILYVLRLNPRRILL